MTQTLFHWKCADDALRCAHEKNVRVVCVESSVPCRREMELKKNSGRRSELGFLVDNNC